jgi:hypothetical protein
MICPKCKKETSEESRFCPNCGANLNKPKTNYMWFSLIVLILIVSICSVIYFNKANNEHKNNKVASSNNTSKEKTQEIATTKQTKSDKISPEAATEKVKKIDPFDDIVLLNTAPASNGSVKGADELIGKTCYWFGFKGGNGCFYVVNAENGDTYECLEESAGVLTLAPAKQKEAPINNNSTNDQNNNSSTPNTNTNQKSEINSAGLEVTQPKFTKFPGSKYTHPYLRAEFKLKNISNSSKLLDTKSFCLRQSNGNAINPNTEGGGYSYNNSSTVYYDWKSIELKAGDSCDVSCDFNLNENQPNTFDLYYNNYDKLALITHIQ